MHTTSVTTGTAPAPWASRLGTGNFVLLALLAGLLAAGCDALTAPDLDGGLDAARSGPAIAGAPNPGGDGFYFLPPMFRQPDHSGTFDANLAPVVEICSGTDCADLHASFDMTGDGSERVRIDEAEEHYGVNWHSRNTIVEAGQTYRVRVRVDGRVLGFADVKIVQDNQEARDVDSEFVPLVSGRTLQIKFRIEKGIVGQVAVSPEEATIFEGETQQFVATVLDLHGQELAGSAVTWSSSDDAVATVDQNGLATGLAGGATTISASAGSVSATAELTIESAEETYTEWLFSNCGATGATGPSQSQCASAYAGTSLQGAVTISDGIQTWTAPAAGTYRITAVGAQGISRDTRFRGGRGARIAGDFQLAAGDVLQLAVGQMGGSNNFSGGGGGGSFVVAGDDTPLLIAGGGGGAMASVAQDGCDARIEEFGGGGSGNSASFVGSICPVRTSGSGQGGTVTAASWGSGGAGFFSNGANDGGWGRGGSSWANGILGGVSEAGCTSPLAPGGFGGGGSGDGCFTGGGGGGGYSGGNGGRVAGGGGSFNSGANPSATAGIGTSHGWILIERVDA